MTFWGWILAILLCIALLGFIVQMAEYIFDFNFDDWSRKQSSIRRAKAAKDAAANAPKPEAEPVTESAKESDSGFFNIHITGNFTVHKQSAGQQDKAV